MLTNKYLELPNLPKSKVSTCLIDYRMSECAKNTLIKTGIKLLPTKRLSSLYDAISAHPDIQIHHLYDNVFVCEPSLYDYYCELMPDAVILKGNSTLYSKYPLDIAYNAVRVGKCFFHNLKYTDSVLYEYYHSIGVKLINVKQGYTKCSVCVVNENAIITSDVEIAKKAKENLIDTLYFNPGQIKLESISNGFVGGICGKISNNVIAVNGDIKLCNNGIEFIEFCKKHSVEVLKLSDYMPYDIGSIIPVRY